MKNFIYLLLLMFCSTNVWAQQDTARPRDPWKNTRMGNGLYKNKDYVNAEKKYREALKTDSASPVVNSNLGSSLYEQKKYEEAAEAFDQAARHSTGDTAAKAYYNKGNALFQQGDLEGSAEAYKEALRRNPKDEDARHNLAMTQRMLNARKKGWKDSMMNLQKDQQGKFLKKDSTGDKQLKQQQQKQKDPKGKEGQKKNVPLDPKKQSMSPEEARKVMNALKESEQKTRQRLNKQGDGSWYDRSKEKDW